MMTGIGMIGGIGLIFMVLFWGALIFGGVWFVKTFIPNSGKERIDASPSQQSPREILNLRYARGEITREQYEVMKADLTQ